MFNYRFETRSAADFNRFISMLDSMGCKYMTTMDDYGCKYLVRYNLSDK